MVNILKPSFIARWPFWPKIIYFWILAAAKLLITKNKRERLIYL